MRKTGSQLPPSTIELIANAVHQSRLVTTEAFGPEGLSRYQGSRKARSSKGRTRLPFPHVLGFWAVGMGNIGGAGGNVR